MKKLLGLFAGLFLTLTTFAQAPVSFNDASETYNKKSTLSFNFAFDGSFDQAKLEETGTYYTNYFSTTVVPNGGEEGYAVTITLNEESEMGRRVIMRYFVSLEVEKIAVAATEYSTEDFMIQFIQL